MWPAGGHLGWAEEQPHPLIHLGCRQLQLCSLQPCGSKTVRQFQQLAKKSDNCLNLCLVLVSLPQTELLASCASDRSIVLYDMRESTPLKKVAAGNSSCCVSVYLLIYHLRLPVGDNGDEEQHIVLEPYGSLLLHSFKWGLQVGWAHEHFLCVCTHVCVHTLLFFIC